MDLLFSHQAFRILKALKQALEWILLNYIKKLENVRHEAVLLSGKSFSFLPFLTKGQITTREEGEDFLGIC